MTGRQLHRRTAMALSALMAVIGVALVIEAAAGSSGMLSGRALLGVLFLAAGAGRMYVEMRRGSGT